MLLSIVVPCFNSEKFLSGLLHSIYTAGISKNMEVILVDDGSTDETFDTIRKLSFEKEWVRGVGKSNGGPASARNFGAKNALGEFLIFLDADDELEEGCLGKVERFVLANPCEDFYVGRGSVVNACGVSARPMPAQLSGGSSESHVLDYLEGRLSIQQGGYVVRRASFLKCYFPEGLKTQEDIPFFLASLARHNVCCMPVDMVRYHKYRGSVSKARDEAIIEGFRNFDVLFSPPYAVPALMRLKYVLYRAKARSLLRYIAKSGALADVMRVMSDYHARVGGRGLLDLPLIFKALKTCGYVLRKRL
ncbi:glycosyltransferase family 2 protein [Alcanivorax sp. S71-1-4]|uniref:glycosyltransferase family 2 protein n=1 Tax=Alcanivorax sp. S71-1-4 TaxID=1177159 RepID=UPI00135C5DC5|nr:glycosyltransferase family 2 protein [Alcanivorax sp. S71-1-4]